MKPVSDVNFGAPLTGIAKVMKEELQRYICPTRAKRFGIMAQADASGVQRARKIIIQFAKYDPCSSGVCKCIDPEVGHVLEKLMKGWRDRMHIKNNCIGNIRLVVDGRAQHTISHCWGDQLILGDEANDVLKRVSACTNGQPIWVDVAQTKEFNAKYWNEQYMDTIVYVVSTELIKSSKADLTTTDAVVLACCSTWGLRGWTYSECAMAGTVRLVCRDGYIDLDEAITSLSREHADLIPYAEDFLARGTLFKQVRKGGYQKHRNADVQIYDGLASRIWRFPVQDIPRCGNVLHRLEGDTWDAALSVGARWAWLAICGANSSSTPGKCWQPTKIEPWGWSTLGGMQFTHVTVKPDGLHLTGQVYKIELVSEAKYGFNMLIRGTIRHKEAKSLPWFKPPKIYTDNGSYYWSQNDVRDVVVNNTEYYECFCECDKAPTVLVVVGKDDEGTCAVLACKRTDKAKYFIKVGGGFIFNMQARLNVLNRSKQNIVIG